MDIPSRREVRAAYERIAESFAGTRRQPWPTVRTFLESLPVGLRVLDLGCGNGRHAGLLASRGQRVLALDFSRRLLRLGRRTWVEESSRMDWVEGDAAALPLADGAVQACLCVAVLHHLPTPTDRRAAVREVRRVLAPGAPALFSVWDREQPRFRSIPAEASGDVEVPWTLPDGTRVPRYYHLFRLEEFRRLIIDSGLQGESFFRASGNIFSLARRHGRPGYRRQ